jgi:hypothetical protein
MLRRLPEFTPPMMALSVADGGDYTKLSGQDQAKARLWS